MVCGHPGEEADTFLSVSGEEIFPSCPRTLSPSERGLGSDFTADINDIRITMEAADQIRLDVRKFK